MALGLLVTIGLWWTYFDRFAGVAEERLREHDDPVLAAADGYSYLHLAIVAGIIVFAVGVKETIHDVDHALTDAGRLALCGGLALYLLGCAGFWLRMTGSVARAKLATVAGVTVLFAVGGGLSGLWVMAFCAVLLVALCTVETLAADEPS